MKVNIRINLLPPEFRSAGVDPKLKLILGASGLAAVGLLLFTWLYLVFSTSSLGDELKGRQQDIFAYKKEAVQVDTLLDEINDYKERERAIISIKTNRILWSKKLTELVRLTPDHIWLIRLDMKERVAGSVGEHLQCEVGA